MVAIVRCRALHPTRSADIVVEIAGKLNFREGKRLREKEERLRPRGKEWNMYVNRRLRPRGKEWNMNVNRLAGNLNVNGAIRHPVSL